jgi:hypothetical protein
VGARGAMRAMAFSCAPAASSRTPSAWGRVSRQYSTTRLIPVRPILDRGAHGPWFAATYGKPQIRGRPRWRKDKNRVIRRFIKANIEETLHDLARSRVRHWRVRAALIAPRGRPAGASRALLPAVNRRTTKVNGITDAKIVHRFMYSHFLFFILCWGGCVQ